MNQKEFVGKSDEILNCMSIEELRRCLHNIARKTPENKRASFLQLLEDCHDQDDREDREDSKYEEALQHKRLIPNEKEGLEKRHLIE
ncbi:hypothetical protein [Desulfosporosinus metallidurans]|uniref:Uncharacterized protein n=1 Tax=Desulfosporosinus metallidurans TaxID=1888891 RepID=A0A1Q8QFF5_9FIRM|nr:hypothetical protein [Desulfosporosinus metallidurans]OLN26076.1 hypothetical protein DSOL_5136 [Desulfosporosinus metallidurans]